jgi:hypothetical protein
MPLPGGIVFINTDLVEQVRDTIAVQLYITEILDGYEYDDRLALNPDFPTLARNNNMRIMVIRPFNDYTNRETADVAMFFSHGVVSVEKNNFGPPGMTFRAAEIYWGKLCVYVIPQHNVRCPFRC